jgi:hypothetical protein
MSEAYEKFIEELAREARFVINEAEDQDVRSLAFREWRPRFYTSPTISAEQSEERSIVLGNYRQRNGEEGFLGDHADLTPFLEKARAENCVDCYTIKDENSEHVADAARHEKMHRQVLEGPLEEFTRARPSSDLDLEALIDFHRIEHKRWKASFNDQIKLLSPQERYFYKNYPKLHCPKHPLPSFED